MTTQAQATEQSASILSSFFSSPAEASAALGMDDMMASVAAPAADGFDFLSELLEESMGEVRDRNELKEARKLLKKTNLPGSQQAQLKSIVQDLEYRAEWIAMADVIWVKRCVCEQCEKETPQFAGYFRRSRNRHTKVDRWVSLSAEVESVLPREMKTEMTTVAMCADCIPQILMEDGWLTAEEDVSAMEPSDDQPEIDEEDLLITDSRKVTTYKGEANDLDAMDNQFSDSDFAGIL